MKFTKRMIIIVVFIFTLLEILIEAVPSHASNSLKGPINVGVVFYRFDDPYVIALKQSLENIEEKNKEKIKFTFYDSKNDKVIQNKNINTLLENGKFDVLVLSLVDLINDPKEIINEIKNKNTPTIFSSKRVFQVDENIIKSYDKAYYVLPNSEQAGRLQGEMLADIWNKNKNDIDTNKDEIMEYVILQGGASSMETYDRTKYFMIKIKDLGIKAEQIASEFCNWDGNLAEEKMDGLLVQYANKIEVVIANNDVMAIGAVKALQKHGYNKGDNTKTIPVVGIDAIPESLDLIKKGYMSGTVLQDPDVMAEEFYEITVHLTENTHYDFTKKYDCDETGRIIKLPFKEYIG